jgi:hypothetical protein
MFMICLHTNWRMSDSNDQFIIAMKPKSTYVNHTFVTPSDILQDPPPQKSQNIITIVSVLLNTHMPIRHHAGIHFVIARVEWSTAVRVFKELQEAQSLLLS